jgi:nitroimidazol reductase NimA-like FMN-containing flavoprotein (pyridoxamine 5'-phosphate oxidase superfamily)
MATRVDGVRASRPRFNPGYGIADTDEGLLSWEWALERLAASRNYWISTTRSDGRPHAMPVWGVLFEDALWFGTSDESVKGRNLQRSGRLVAHTESGDECVILEGRAEQVETPAAMLDAYEAKYDFRPEAGRFWVVRPTLAFAWRERDYPASATRFLPT